MQSSKPIKPRSSTLTTIAQIGLETTKTMLNPSLAWPFFTGKPIFSGIPHLNAGTPLGQLHFTAETTDQLTATALKTPNGIATYWAGPFLPVIYIASNEARHALVQESHVGSTNTYSEQFLAWITGGNGVMNNFPAFMSVHSDRYQIQRQFLLKYFHAGAKTRLSEIHKSAGDFLKNYSEVYGENPRSLREFINLLVLNTSSQMLDLTSYTLDKLYLQKPKYRDAINQVAQYGISERGNPELEKTLYNLFCEIFKKNFGAIYPLNYENNFIHAIFNSMNMSFPKNYEAFYKLPKQTKYAIAMTFSATALAGLVHSTVNSLDWALARLLQDPDKLNELTRLVTKYKDIDLTIESTFDKTGPLSKLSEWVLHSVYLYPTFSNEFFFNSEPFAATLPDGSKINVPGKSFIVVNYGECNRLNKQVTSKDFSESLQDESTVGRFIMNKQVSSFGGSKINKNNKNTRICPGAKTSLYEQMILIATILRDYSLELTDLKDMSCEVDRSKHPLCTRVNHGNVLLKKPTESKCEQDSAKEKPSLADEKRISLMTSCSAGRCNSDLRLFEEVTPKAEPLAVLTRRIRKSRIT